MFDGTGSTDYQASFEHGRVQMLLAACGYTFAEQNHHAAALREAGRQFGAEGYLTFRALYASETFNDFPVRLKTMSIGSAKGVLDLRTCFKHFTATTYHHFYLRVWHTHRHNDRRPLGVIFNYPAGGIILHNAAVTGDADGRFAATYRSADQDEPPLLTLESYRGFLKRVVPLWKSLSFQIPTAQAQTAITPRFERWMVERYGSGPAVIVAAWLRGAMADPEIRPMSSAIPETADRIPEGSSLRPAPVPSLSLRSSSENIRSQVSRWKSIRRRTSATVLPTAAFRPPCRRRPNNLRSSN